jgi:hypothetical protein
VDVQLVGTLVALGVAAVTAGAEAADVAAEEGAEVEDAEVEAKANPLIYLNV